MGFLDKAKNVASKGLAQSLADAAASAIDKASSGADGPSPVRRFIRERGYTGTSVSSALIAAEEVIAGAEIELYWPAWHPKYGASSDWTPWVTGANGMASVVHFVVAGGRILALSDDGALLFEYRPSPGSRPTVQFVNKVAFARVPPKKAEYGKAKTEVIYSFVPASYQFGDPEDPVVFQGAVVTLPETDGRPSMDLIVLVGELDSIVDVLSG